MSETEEQARNTETNELQSHPLILEPRSGEEEAIPFKERSFSDTLLTVLISVFVAAALVGTSFVSGAYRETEPAHRATEETPTVEYVLPTTRNPYYELSLEAQAAGVYDLYDDRILFAQNANSPRPLASLTKIMTSIVAEERSRASVVSIPPESILQEGDSGLYAQETWNLKDLLSFMLVSSSNDGADAVAVAVGSQVRVATSSNSAESMKTFVSMMNDKAVREKWSSLQFSNPSGRYINSIVRRNWNSNRCCQDAWLCMGAP